MSATARTRRRLDRYILCDQIASGGMATVHLGRLVGPAGFARTVAIKRLHPHLAGSPRFSEMLLQEARVAARIRHPNVVSVLDVATADGELLLVMEYVAGQSLSELLRRTHVTKQLVSPLVVSGILGGALDGLHAAHEARSEDGTALQLVHRDVSPHNILVGVDGTARVVDFGIAKALGRIKETATGELKGKLSYMAPEQLLHGVVDRRTDIFAAGIVLWEALTGQYLFDGDSIGDIAHAVSEKPIVPPSLLVPDVPSALDDVVARALERDPAQRFQTAREMADALALAAPPAAARQIGMWVEATGHDVLEQRAQLVHEIESETTSPGAPQTSDAGEEPNAVAFSDPHTGPPPDERRRAWPFIAVVALVMVSLPLTMFAWTRQKLDATADDAGTVAAASATPPPSATASDRRSAQASPSVAGSVDAVGSAPALHVSSAAAPPSALPRRASGRSRPPRSPASGGSAPAASPSPSCVNPFVIDENGVRTPRPECFGSQ